MKRIDVDAIPTAEELRDMFIEGASEGIAELFRQNAAARAGEQEWSEAILVMRGIAHDIKGQGGSFGYPLITDIGHSLSALLKHDRLLTENGLELLSAHLEALSTILKRAIEGEGGDLGSSFVQRLCALVDQL